MPAASSMRPILVRLTARAPPSDAVSPACSATGMLKTWFNSAGWPVRALARLACPRSIHEHSLMSTIMQVQRMPG